MIAYERTRDLSLVRAILTDPKVYRHIGDDDAAPRLAFQPNPDPRIEYLVATDKDAGLILGLFMLLPESRVCAEIHVAMLPEAWGNRSKQAGECVLSWIWKHTGYFRIFARVPAFNRLAVRYAALMHLEYCGVNFESFLKHGKLHDQIWYGASRPGELPPPPFGSREHIAQAPPETQSAPQREHRQAGTLRPFDKR